MTASLELKHIELAGAFSYQHPAQHVDLDKQGRVLISGKEGSGKTTIPEVITSVLYGRGSPRLRKARLSESAIVNNRTIGGYYARLDLISNGHPASILQAHKHKKYGSSYRIYIDGKLKTPDGKRQQRDLVNRLVPISFDEWLGTGYLHQGGVHDLLAGTPAEKKAYLTNVFGLGVYDAMLDSARDEEKALKNVEASSLGLQQQLAEAKAERKSVESKLDKIIEDDWRTDIAAWQKKNDEDVQAARARLEKATKTLAKLESKASAANELGEMKAKLKKLNVDSATAKTSLSDAKAEISRLTKRRLAVKELIARAERGLGDYREAKAEMTSLRQKFDDIKEKLKTMGTATADATTLKDALSLVEKASAVSDRLLDADPLAPDDANVDWSANAKQFVRLKQEIKSVREACASDDSCPVCTRPLDKASVEGIVSTLSKKATASLKKAHAGLAANLSKRVGRKELTKLANGVDTIADLEKKLRAALASSEKAKELTAKLTATSDHLDAARKLYARAKAECLDDDEFAGAKKKLAAMTATLSSEEEKVARLESALTLIDGIRQRKEFLADDDKLDAVGVKAEQKRLSKVYDQKLAGSQEAASLLGQLSAVNKTIKGLKARIDQEADNTVRLRGLQAFTIPFLTAIRGTKIRECLGVLEEVLPVYVQAMFSSKYRNASIRMTVDDDFKNVDMSLKTEGWKKPVSALQASGGERRRFTLAILGALREITPRRANVLFLDEPFQDLKSSGKMLFVERVMPMMLERCPGLTSIFVIAHDHEVLHSAANSFDSVWQVKNSRKHGSIIKTRGGNHATV
jgi:DNA repair exonuclease SbcCD ATPase subunit